VVGLITVLASVLGFFLVVMKYFVSHEILGLVELVGPALSVGGYLAPVQTVVLAVKRSNLKDLPLPVFVSQLSLCIVSIAYGLKIANQPILLTNILGACVQICWLSCWYLVKWRQGGRRAMHPALFTVMLGLFLSGVASVMAHLDEDVIGLLSLGLSFTFSFSPLAQLPMIIRTRSSASVPLAMSGMMFLGNLCWGVYGYLLGISVIFIPCLVGLEIAVFLIVVNLWCAGFLPLDLAFLGKLFPSEQAPLYVHHEPELVPID
jgi:uncharacterized protein with PQ loop repeat